MHRVYWVLFTVLCACVVSVPSSQRFNTKRGHIGRALSKLRTSRRHSVLGASRGNRPSTGVNSEKNFPDDQFPEIYKDGSKAFLNPHHLQDKIETLADTDEHFVDYGDDEGYDVDGAHDPQVADIDEVYYDDSFGSDQNDIRIVGQSTESGQILDEVRHDYSEEEDELDKEGDDYDEEEDDFDLNMSESKTLDQYTESEHSLDREDDGNEEDGEEFDSDPNEFHVFGQSAQAEQLMDIDDDKYDDEEDGDFESYLDDIDIVGHFSESEELSDAESDEYHGEEADFEPDPNDVRVLGQSTESEQSSYYEDDDYGGEDEEFESDPNENEVVHRSTASEESLEEDEDEYDEGEHDFDSNLENVRIVGQSVDSREQPEDNQSGDTEAEDDSVNKKIPVVGQSTETENVNETEHNLDETDQFGNEDAIDHDVNDEDLELDNEETGDLQDMMVQGQALLLGDSESDHTDLLEGSKGDEQEWAEDELYEPLDEVMMAHYQDDDANDESFEGDVPVDGMSYHDEPRAPKNVVTEEESEVSGFDDDFESEIDDTDDIDPVEHEDELPQDQHESQRSASEIDFNQDIEAFDNELSSMVRQDRVNGQSALQDSHSSSYSFSAVRQELDSENEEDEMAFNDDLDHEDEDNELEDDVGVARTVATSHVESHDGYFYGDGDGDNDIYLDDDDDVAEDDHQYIRSLKTEASESDASDGTFDVERLADDAENDVHVDGFAFVKNADADHDMLAADESVSYHDESISYGSRFESNEHHIPHWETDDEELHSHDDDDYDDEENRWAFRQDADYFKEDIMPYSDENDDLQKRADDDWNEYLLDLASVHQEQEMADIDTSLSSDHELSDNSNYRWEDTNAVYDEHGQYEINDEFGINSHSHDVLHDSVKSIAV